MRDLSPEESIKRRWQFAGEDSSREENITGSVAIAIIPLFSEIEQHYEKNTGLVTAKQVTDMLLGAVISIEGLRREINTASKSEVNQHRVKEIAEILVDELTMLVKYMVALAFNFDQTDLMTVLNFKEQVFKTYCVKN